MHVEVKIYKHTWDLTNWLVYTTGFFQHSGHVIAYNSSKSFLNGLVVLLLLLFLLEKRIRQKQKWQGCQTAC